VIVVYIVGTDHRLQTADGRATARQIESFRSFLREVCQSRRVVAIAEEMCVEGVRQFSLEESICLQEAKRLGLHHRYCDPDTEERKPLNIRTKSELEMEVFFDRLTRADLAEEVRRASAKREKIWVDRLRALNASPVLFVCGADHPHSFADEVRAAGFAAEIVAADWSPNPPLQPTVGAGG
jgi:hypothetical protein